MKKVRLIGGLGNQLFQYAFYLYLRQHFKDVAIDVTSIKSYNLHNGYSLERIINDDNLKIVEYKSTMGKLYSKFTAYLPINILKIYNEIPSKRFKFHNITELRRYNYFAGYWQSKEYYLAVKEEVNSNYRKLDLVGKNLDLYNKIVKNNCAFVHIRRGDYLNDDVWNTINDNYYDQAINNLLKLDNNIHFCFFSNDMKYVKSRYTNIKDVSTFVDWNSGKDAYKDLYLMSMCKYGIISNSTFSWWAANLGVKKERVIAPKKWKNKSLKHNYDLYLNNWERI